MNNSSETDFSPPILIEEDSKDQFYADSNDEDRNYWSWIKRLNLFQKGEIPPVPEHDAGLVPEMQAGWFSRFTWGWMTPLMIVFLSQCEVEVGFRRDIGVHCNKRTSGVMIRINCLKRLQISLWQT